MCVFIFHTFEYLKCGFLYMAALERVPKDRSFVCNNSSISKIYKHNTIPRNLKLQYMCTCWQFTKGYIRLSFNNFCFKIVHFLNRDFYNRVRLGVSLLGQIKRQNWCKFHKMPVKLLDLVAPQSPIVKSNCLMI